MTLLVAGLLLWMVVHLPKAVAPGPRARLVTRIGESSWRGLVSLLLVAALALMIVGYRGATPVMAYRPPAWGDGAGTVVAIIGMVLFAASAPKTNIKRYLRHPQLLSVVLWGVGHLLAGGSRRGLVLFGGLALWAILEMTAINRRDGAWQRPAPVPRRADLIVIAIGLVLAALVIAVHEWRGISVVSG